MNARRLEQLTQEVLANGLDGIALVPGPNMLYLSGIRAHLSERPIVLFLPADDDPAIIIPSLEAEKARAAGVPPDRIFAWSDDEGYTGAFQLACAHLELSDYLLGVEALQMRVLELELLRRYAPSLNTAHAEPIIGRLRQIKDDREIATMQRAARIAETAMERLMPRIRTGMTEKQIAVMLSHALAEAGSESIPFGPIVSAGPNGASPHATPTDRPIQAGDLLVVDWGAMVDDYASDITRTFAVGEVEPELARIHEIVREANAAGQAAARPDVTGRAIDRATRAVIESQGYGDYFIHRTGHGLGLEIHEPPFIAAGSTESLPAGAVFTIEPGIYLAGRAGVRIEDDVVLTSAGCHSLTTMPRELIQLG
jgi:Xaa-Pro dipeptidase